MKTIVHQQIIEAPIDRVWHSLADIGSVADYNDGLESSHWLGPKRGLGGARRCVINAKLSLDEEITALEEGKSYTLELVAAQGFQPMAHVKVDFQLTALSPHRTQVEQRMGYRLKGGALGQMFSPLLSGTVRTALERNLAGLAAHVTAGPTHRSRPRAQAALKLGLILATLGTPACARVQAEAIDAPHAVTELGVYSLKPEARAGFDELHAQIMAIVEQQPGFLGIVTERALKEPGVYVDRIRWRSPEDFERASQTVGKELGPKFMARIEEMKYWGLVR